MEIELVNFYITGKIELTKVDEDYPENKLTGAVFEVYADKNGDGKLDKDDELLGTMGEVEKGVYQMATSDMENTLSVKRQPQRALYLTRACMAYPLRKTARPMP